MGGNPQHIALSLFLKDSAVSSETKVERLTKVGLIGKKDHACSNLLLQCGPEIFVRMHNQILDARLFPGIECIIHTSAERPETLVSHPFQKLVDPVRQRVCPNQRVDRVIQDVKVSNVLRSKGVRMLDVTSRTNHSVARNFVPRVDGSNCAVFLMYAGYTGQENNGKKEHVAIKIPYESSKRSEVHLRHEAAVLKRLNENNVRHVQRLWDEGIFEVQADHSVLITRDLRCGEDHNGMLNCIDILDLFSIFSSLASALNGMHSLDMTHGLITMNAVHFNFVTKDIYLCDMKYAESNDLCPVELACMKPTKAVIVDDAQIQVVDCESQVDKKRKDCADLGLVFINLLSRTTLSIGFRATGDQFELKVQDGYDKFTSANLIGSPFLEVAHEMCNRFNHFVCNQSLQISTESPALEALECLLAGTCSLAQVHQILSSAADSAMLQNSDSVSEWVVPAKFIKNEHAMMYPVRLKPVECVDNQGRKSLGYGTFAEVDANDGDIVGEYSVCTVPSSLAETLREFRRGCHFKTTGPSRNKIFYGAREENGVIDINFMVQHNQVFSYYSFLRCPLRKKYLTVFCWQVASLIQGAYEVKVNIHPTDPTQNTVYVRRKKANCRFQHKIWPSERLPYYPGNPERTDVILVYATEIVKKGDQFFIDYGDQSAREFFGVESILGIDEPWPIEEDETAKQSRSKRSRI